MPRAHHASGGWPPRARLPLSALLRLRRAPPRLHAIWPLLGVLLVVLLVVVLLVVLLEGRHGRGWRPGRRWLLCGQGGSTACGWHHQQAKPWLCWSLQRCLLGEKLDAAPIDIIVLLFGAPAEASAGAGPQDNVFRGDHGRCQEGALLASATVRRTVCRAALLRRRTCRGCIRPFLLLLLYLCIATRPPSPSLARDRHSAQCGGRF